MKKDILNLVALLQYFTVNVDDDILIQSSFGFETKVIMGEKIGEKNN